MKIQVFAKKVKSNILKTKQQQQQQQQQKQEYLRSVRLAIPARVVMGTWGISPFILKFSDGSAYTDILVQVPAIITSHLPSTEKNEKEKKN